MSVNGDRNSIPIIAAKLTESEPRAARRRIAKRRLLCKRKCVLCVQEDETSETDLGMDMILLRSMKRFTPERMAKAKTADPKEK